MHLCFHDDHGPHQCGCCIDEVHTDTQFKNFHKEMDVPILSSQIDFKELS